MVDTLKNDFRPIGKNEKCETGKGGIYPWNIKLILSGDIPDDIPREWIKKIIYITIYSSYIMYINYIEDHVHQIS